MVDLTGARAPSWQHWLLNSRDERIRRLDGVTGGSVDHKALSRLGSAGSVSIDKRGETIDWRTQRLQSIYDPGIPGVAPWPMATMRFTSPTEHHGTLVTSYDVELLSKVSIIDAVTVPLGYAVAAGSNVVATVVALIQSTGETRIAATPSDKILPEQLVFDEPETSLLTVINKLLTGAGYWSLSCDYSGQFRVEPYVEPGAREPSWTFEEGDRALHYASWDRTQDLASIPNVYVVQRQGSDTAPGIQGVARNDDPASPWSTVSTGFEISRSETAEVETQSDAEALAQRRLLELSAPLAKIAASHAMLPLSVDQVVRFIDDGHDVRASIQALSFSFDPFTDMSAEWREL